MSEPSSKPAQETEASAEAMALNTSRRRLVRAGLAAAPVVAAFKTNMVLAGGRRSGDGVTIRASSFASIAANGSNASVSPNAQITGQFVPLEECIQKCSKGGKHEKKKFGFDGGDGNGCGFKSSFDGQYTEKTPLHVVLTNRGGQAKDDLARFVVAGYISSEEYGADSFISAEQCRKIWENNGTWSPVAGVTWDMQQTCTYFNKVYHEGFDNLLASGSGKEFWGGGHHGS